MTKKQKAEAIGKRIELLEDAIADLDAMGWELEDLYEEYHKLTGKHYEF